MDPDIRRARAGAQLAVNASRLVAGNLQRTEPAECSKEGPVGAEETTPEILEQNRQNHEHDDCPEGKGRDLCEEQVHLNRNNFV